MKHLTKIIMLDSWIFLRDLVFLMAIAFVILGVIMTMKGIAGGGTINLQTAIIEGTLETGTTGLLFSFLGFVLLLCCLYSRAVSKITISKKSDGTVSITHKGALTKSKAKNIIAILKEEPKYLNGAE